MLLLLHSWILITGLAGQALGSSSTSTHTRSPEFEIGKLTKRDARPTQPDSHRSLDQRRAARPLPFAHPSSTSSSSSQFHSVLEVEQQSPSLNWQLSQATSSDPRVLSSLGSVPEGRARPTGPRRASGFAAERQALEVEMARRMRPQQTADPARGTTARTAGPLPLGSSDHCSLEALQRWERELEEMEQGRSESLGGRRSDAERSGCCGRKKEEEKLASIREVWAAMTPAQKRRWAVRLTCLQAVPLATTLPGLAYLFYVAFAPNGGRLR